MTKQAMGQLVDHLEDGGYVTREPDPDDGRAKLVGAHEEGRARGTNRDRSAGSPRTHVVTPPR